MLLAIISAIIILIICLVEFIKLV